MGTYYLVEYVYSNNPLDPWRVVQRSGWQAYGNGAKADVAWQLTADPGVHYLQAFVADKAGNVVTAPGLEFLNVQSGAVSVAQDEVKIYRITPDADAPVTVRLEVLSGNPDLYVFGENAIFADGLDTAVEEFSFTADGGIYQIEVEGYQSGSYRLEVSGGGVRALPDSVGLDARRRRSIITLSAYAPTTEDAELPVPPAVTGPAAIGRVMYLPYIEAAE
ncbi:MAG: hypothetical protein HC822_04565 [Oscillochloris sp.]|nr:hypothetical protein [Oscillochloris sp.]